MAELKVIGPRDPKDSRAIITTSISKGLGKQFSPFVLGPVKLYKGAVASRAMNVENAWQFSKVYKQYIGDDGNPAASYFEWAKQGWLDTRAHRYPMGKGARPEYAWWDGEKLDYIEARKRIYFPLYANAVRKTKAFKILKKGYEEGEDIILWDFDGYDHKSLGMTLKDVLNDTSRPMGHAFIIMALLEGTFEKKG